MNDEPKPPVIILGAGGHASVLVELCLEQNRSILALISPEPDLNRKIFQGLRHFSDDKAVLDFSPNDVELIIGFGGVRGSELREKFDQRYSSFGYRFATLVSRSALISRTATLSEGVQVLPRAVINAGALVGRQSIINSGSIVEHDCIVENFVHVAPNATICGGTTIRQGVQVGPNCVIAQGLEIGAYSIIGAGASVVRSMNRFSRAMPQKTIKTSWKVE